MQNQLLFFTNLIPSYLINSKEYSVCVIGMDGNYLFLNDGFKKKYQCHTDNMFIGKPFHLTIHPDDKAICGEVAYKCIKNPDKVFNVKIRKPIKNNTDEFYWTNWEFSTLKNDQNEIIGIFCIGTDTTENHHNFFEKEKYFSQLKASETKLRAILDSSTSSNILISPDYKILCFNKIAYELIKIHFQKEIKEGDDMHLYILENTIKNFDIDFQNALDGQSIETERELLFAQNIKMWVKLNYFPVYDHQKNIMGVSFNSLDITAQKKAEVKIKQQSQILEDISWEQSHRLRKPVANILGLVNLLQDAKNDSYQNIEKYVYYLQIATEELDKIIRHIVAKTDQS